MTSRSRARPTPPLRYPPAPAVDVEGVSRFITPNRDFYRVDTALSVPKVPADGYTLRIHGMVDKELEAQLPRPAQGAPRRAAASP